MVVIDALVEVKARAAVRVLSRHSRVRAAYLFGSQVDGTAHRWSDIDIAVFIDGADSWDFDRRIAACVEPQRLVGNDVEVHLFSAESHRAPPRASFAQHILRHGVKLELDAEPN